MVYNNFIHPHYSVVSMAGFKGQNPYIKVSVEKPQSLEDAQAWLNEYMTKIYKQPTYSEDSEAKTKFAELFASAEDNETPLYIWQGDKAVIALVEQYDEFVPQTRVYVKAEPVKTE